ncbi:AraC family ligand binding domain-containing protein [Tenacibaculum sp. nBUS_03]|uniref:AraC family ligand binding domain-containing protein n=1 Tax=Tenacibaculum sp. nBUS_03 TaxID=3395320 RepID=UPI003EBE0989
MKKYDLHKNDFAELHFELKTLEPYFQRNKEKATKPHRHSFFQILWFKERGNHYIDYNVVEHDVNTLFLINKNQVHYFCPDSSNSGYLLHFNDSFISNSSLDLLNRFELSIFNEIDSPNFSLDKKDAKIIDDLTYNLLVELEEKKLNHLQIITHELISLLYYIERIKQNSGSFNRSTKSGFSAVVTFKQAVFENVDKNYGVQDYSELVGSHLKS